MIIITKHIVWHSIKIMQIQLFVDVSMHLLIIDVSFNLWFICYAFYVFDKQIILEDSKYLPSCVRILNKVSEDLSKVYTSAGRGELAPMHACMN